MKQELNKNESIPFTQIANNVLNDEKLTLKAKGLFCYLYSKPVNWDFSYKRIAKDSKDGVTSVLNSLKELERNNYLRRTRRADGTMEYLISFDYLEKPSSEKPNLGKSQVGKTQTISNKELLSNKDITNNIEYIYKQFTQKINKGSKLTDSAKDKIKVRLKNYTLEELSLAIDNFSKSSWWMENNADRGVAWFFQNDDRIDQFLNLKPEKQHTKRETVVVYNSK